MKKILLIISILPLLINCNQDSLPKPKLSKEEKSKVLTEIKLMENAKIYSDSAIILLNKNAADGIVEKEIVEKHNLLLIKSIEIAKRVDISILEKMKKGFGKKYQDKYIRGLELRLEGIKNSDGKKALEGQILYDEYVNFVNKLKTQ